MKTYVIYHSNDFDGIFCREIAKRFIPDAVLVGWDYGQPTPLKAELKDYDRLYIMDLSVPDLMDHPSLIWIDHHKSAIDKYSAFIPGYRIDGVAACRLVWQWFVAVDRLTNQGSSKPDWVNKYPFPEKREFVERNVCEPLAVRLVGEYDIWDKRDSNAELFQHGLRSRELSENLWDLLLVNIEEHPDGVVDVGTITVRTLLEAGESLQYAKTQENKSIINAYGFDLEFEGLKFLCCNHARFNSFLFTAGLQPHHDALLGFNWTGKQWRVSLYHAPEKEHHDLSVIATKYGGGGHRGACGFTCSNLPFSL